MNTNTKQDQKKNQGQKSRLDQGTKKQGQNPNLLQNRKHQDHEQEHPETRLTR